MGMPRRFDGTEDPVAPPATSSLSNEGGIDEVAPLIRKVPGACVQALSMCWEAAVKDVEEVKLEEEVKLAVEVEEVVKLAASRSCWS